MKILLILTFKFGIINFFFAQKEIIKDSLEYYFDYEIVYEEATGFLLACGLPLPDDSTTHEYLGIKSDSSLVLVKTTNMKDGTFDFQFFRRYVVNSKGGACWYPDLVQIKYDASKNVETVRFFNGKIDPPANELETLKYATGE